MTRIWRLGHRWLGAFAAVILISSAMTGWLLQHEGWLQGKGREIRLVAVDPHLPNHVLAAGPEGFWRSTDNGAHWQDVTMPIPTQQVTALVAGQGGFAVALREFGVWSSTDGYIWDRVADAPDDEQIRALSFQGDHLVFLSDKALTVGPHRYVQPDSLQRRIHDWHTGWALGVGGKMAVEAGAIALLVLSGSGVVLFLRTMPRRRREPQPVITRRNDVEATT